jgi:hypothetical protein
VSTLFGRVWSVSVGSLDVSDLDLSFKVERATSRSPGTAEIKISNLSETNRARVESGDVVRLWAGLGVPQGEAPLVFHGDIRRAWTAREGVNRITTITGRDGGAAIATVRMSRSYGPGTPAVQVLRDAVSVLGIGVGNLADFESAYRLRNGSTALAAGYVAHGNARDVLNRFLRAAGLRWSIQGGALQVMTQGRALQSRAVVLAPDSGLVAAAWDETGQRTQGRRGVLSVKALIQPGIEPGRLVRVESEAATGTFEVRKAVWAGDTRTADWHVTCDLRPRA